MDAYGDEPGMGGGLPMIYNLVYCSRATAGVDDAVVSEIIASSRRHNPARGITGMLVFGGGIFFQWLEGPHASVAELMEQLRADPRHEAIVLLSEDCESRERVFPDWDMELVESADIRAVLLDALETVKGETNAATLRLHLAHLDAGDLTGGAAPESQALPRAHAAQDAAGPDPS
jgi:hypothetical protein